MLPYNENWMRPKTNQMFEYWDIFNILSVEEYHIRLHFGHLKTAANPNWFKG
jgi:hypothetical protein